MRRLAKLVTGMIAAVGLVLVQPAVAQHSDELDALNAQVVPALKRRSLTRAQARWPHGLRAQHSGRQLRPDRPPHLTANRHRRQKHACSEPRSGSDFIASSGIRPQASHV